MRQPFPLAVVTYGLLSLAAFLSFVLPYDLVKPASAVAAGPAKIRLPGVVRDFQKSNAQFAVAPSGGNGHYAGNFSLALGADDRPVFTGAGYKVATQWRDKNARPIAPHMYMYHYAGSNVIPVTNPSVTPPKAVFDTYNSASGPYDVLTSGPSPVYAVGAPMPEIVIPLSLKMLNNSGDRTFAGVSTLAANLHCNKLTISGVMNISGNVSVLCEDVFTLSADAIVLLNPGARLTMYLKNGGMSWNHVTVGDPLKPSRVTVYNLGTAQFGIHNHAAVYATFISPNASMYLYNHGAFYGRFMGKMLEFNNHAGFHHDVATPLDACSVALGDTAGSRGAASTGGIPSVAAFNRWFQDVPGVNLSQNYAVTLKDNGSGVYEIDEDGFYPVDNQLFGNEGEAHNNYFTFALRTRFVFEACSGQYFQFEGCDDAWLFVDGVLVMDLGGVMPGTGQYVAMDRLNLVNGSTYTMHFFYAQRNSSISRFNMRTNIALDGEDVLYTVSAGVD